jgi:nitric oxide dioxygenase
MTAMQENPSALSEHAILLIKSSAPVLQEKGEVLSRHFYERMFRAHPEVAPMFNRMNQKAGTQQRSLAAAICAFAAHVDRLDALGAAVEMIAQKHASLRILPEHYPIVGSNLLASIREVMGEAASDELIDAWRAAYGVLAGILIGREKEIYQRHAAQNGGWVGLRPFRIFRKVRESDVITSFYLEPCDGGPIPVYHPGQYLTLRVEDGRGSSTMRQYSLSGQPGERFFRISVKLEPRGWVSRFLHSRAVGDELQVGPPCGDFFLDVSKDTGRPLALLSAGVGITPMLAMLEAAVKHQPEREVVFVHGTVDGRTQAFGGRIRELEAEHAKLRVHIRYSKPLPDDLGAGRCDSVGIIDAPLIESLMPSRDADYYFCGPKPFMSVIYSQLVAWGVPDGQARFEFFGPKVDFAAPVPQPESAASSRFPF